MLVAVLPTPETPLTALLMVLTLSLMPESVVAVALWALVIAAVMAAVEAEMSLEIAF